MKFFFTAILSSIAAWIIGGGTLLYCTAANLAVMAYFSLITKTVFGKNAFSLFVFSVTLGTIAELFAVPGGIWGAIPSLYIAWAFFLPTFILLLFSKRIPDGWRRFFAVLPLCFLLFLHMIAEEAASGGASHLLPFWTGALFSVTYAALSRRKQDKNILVK